MCKQHFVRILVIGSAKSTVGMATTEVHKAAAAAMDLLKPD